MSIRLADGKDIIIEQNILFKGRSFLFFFNFFDGRRLMDILEIVNSFIQNKEEQQDKVELESEPKKEIQIDQKKVNVNNNLPNRDTTSNVHLIAEKLNNNIPNTRVAREFNVNVNDLAKILKDAGYKFDPFFYIWTKERQEKLIEKAIYELNRGTTLFNYSTRFRKNIKNQRIFADELRKRIEYQGYKFDLNSKKWKTKEELKLAALENKKLQESKNLKVNGSNKNVDRIKPEVKNISCKGLVEKLNKGISLKKIVEETNKTSAELRILLDTNGFNYDSFFNIWINIERKEILDKIAKEVIDKRVSLDYMAKHYNVTREELIEQLLKVGYKVNYGQLRYGIGNDRVNEVGNVERKDELNGQDKHKVQIEEKVHDRVEEKNAANSAFCEIEPESEERLQSNSDLNLDDDEYKLLKEILIERKKQKEETIGKKAFKIYLSNELFEKVEEFTEVNNITKSSLIEKLLEQYLNDVNTSHKDRTDFEQSNKPRLITNSSNEDKKVIFDEKTLFTSKKIKEEIVSSNQVNMNSSSVWDENKEKLLINAVLEGTREGRTLGSIVEDVSKEIGITASKCQSYWYSHVPQKYRDQFKQIKIEQENNWTEEDIKLLEYIVKVEGEHLPKAEAITLASERLKRHINVVQKKWFEIIRDLR
jgi:hypothetical protein